MKLFKLCLVVLLLCLSFVNVAQANNMAHIHQLAGMAAKRYCHKYVSHTGPTTVCLPYKVSAQLKTPDPFLAKNPDADTRLRSSAPPISGRVGLGFDVSQGTFGLPVLDMNYNARTYRDPHSGRVFAVPDEVRITPHDVTKSQTSAKAYRRYEDYIKTLTWFTAPSSSTTVSAAAGMMSHSSNLESIYHKYFGKDLTLGVAQVKSTAYHLEVTGGALDPYFAAAVDYLPEKYDASIYHTFLQYWGTHTTTHAELGGLLERSNMVKECSWNHGNSAGSLANDMSHDIDQLAGKGGKKPGQTYINFRKVASTDILGGNPEIPVSRYQQRVASFVDNPVQTSFTMTRLTNHIAHPAKRANVNRAINEWFSAKRAAAVKQKQAAVNAHNAWLAGPQRIQSGFYTSMPGLKPHVNPSVNMARNHKALTFQQMVRKKHCHHKRFHHKHCHTKTELAYYGHAPVQRWCQRDAQGRVRALSGTGNMINGRRGFTTVGPWVHEGCSIAAPRAAHEGAWTLEEGAGTSRAIWKQNKFVAFTFGVPGRIPDLVRETYHACCIGCGMKTHGSKLVCTCEPF